MLKLSSERPLYQEVVFVRDGRMKNLFMSGIRCMAEYKNTIDEEIISVSSTLIQVSKLNQPIPVVHG